MLLVAGRKSTPAQRRTLMSFKDSAPRACGVTARTWSGRESAPQQTWGARDPCKLGSQLGRGVPDSSWMLQDVQSPSSGRPFIEARNTESAAFAAVVAWLEDGSVRAAIRLPQSRVSSLGSRMCSLRGAAL
jgi:hypothetical protein